MRQGTTFQRGTTLYRRTDGAVEIRYSHWNSEERLQYGYLYDVQTGQEGPLLPLAAFLKFDVFEVVDDPAIIAALSEGEEAWDAETGAQDSAPTRSDTSIGKALMSVLVNDDAVQALSYEITGVDDEEYFRVNGKWERDPGQVNLHDAEITFVAPERQAEVMRLFDTDPSRLLEILDEVEASEDYLRIALPTMFGNPYEPSGESSLSGSAPDEDQSHRKMKDHSASTSSSSFTQVSLTV